MHAHHHPHKPEEEEHWLNKFLRPGLHKDWRAWLVLGLMVAAISIYVLTLDDSMQPGNPPREGAPAAAIPR